MKLAIYFGVPIVMFLAFKHFIAMYEHYRLDIFGFSYKKNWQNSLESGVYKVNAI